MQLQETVRPILPPPPSSSKRGHLERQHTVPAPPTSTSSPVTTVVSKTPPPQGIHWFDKETENIFNDNEVASLDKNSITKKDQENVSINLYLSFDFLNNAVYLKLSDIYLQGSAETTPRNNQTKSPQIDVFTELDPLGTGLIKPYIDKKDFFQHLKNPPKKVLKDLVSTNSSDTFPADFNISTDGESKVSSNLSSRDSEDSNFANFNKFDDNEMNRSTLLSPKKENAVKSIHHQPLSVSLPPEDSKGSLSKGTSVHTSTTGRNSVLKNMSKDSTESTQALVKLPSPKKYLQSVRKRNFDIDLSSNKAQDKSFPVDFSMTHESLASPLRSCSSDVNSRLSSSSAEVDLVPEPPPRGTSSIIINPPPLPPKKQGARGSTRPPPRPPHSEGYFHYDFPQQEVSSSPTRITKDKNKNSSKEIKNQFDDNFSPPSQMSLTSDIAKITNLTFEDSFSSIIPTTSLSSLFSTSVPTESKKTKPLDITLSQLTSSNLDELASSLGITVKELTCLTLQQLTECLANLSTKEVITKEAEQTVQIKEQVTSIEPVISSKLSEMTSSVCSKTFSSSYEQEPKTNITIDKYAVLRELFEMEQMKEEPKPEETVEEEEEEIEVINGREVSNVMKTQTEVPIKENGSERLASLLNLTVKLPPKNENLLKEEAKVDETNNSLIGLTTEEDKSIQLEDKDIEKEIEMMMDPDATSDSSTIQQTEFDEDDTEKTQTITEMEEKLDNSEKESDANGISDRIDSDILNEETNMEKIEVKSSISTSSDRYAALREIMGEPEPLMKKDDEETMNSPRASPVIESQIQPKNLVEVELLNLFSDNLPPPPSPNISAKKDDDLKTIAMDIFEEIKMLNAGPLRPKETKPSSSGFEDMFCPFAETKTDKDDSKEDNNWAKFDTNIFGSDRSSCEGQRSMGGSSPWSPDGKEFHREVPLKGTGYRHSGDSDNEWKDEEESEESNGRMRGDGRFWPASRHPRFDAPGFEERCCYEDTIPGEKRDRNFRERMSRKSRGAPWTKSGNAHRSRDPSPWHEESQWEDEPRRYPHRKVSYKDDEEQYETHWKCSRSKPQRWSRGHDIHGPFYDDERKRKLMLWNEEDRFSSQESMGYDEEDRWSRRKYERRRWEEDNRFWSRRGPSDADYPMREAYYYYRESRDRPHDYPSSTWEEEYGPERPEDDSPRYNPAGRKRHWPKRPNSANEGRNSDIIYADPRKFGASRSECSDNDSDPYLRSSQRSRSRESYWGSDQEYDSWVERPYWSEGPDSKSETLHRKRIVRHKVRQVQKTQSPFEDDFAQNVEQMQQVTGAVEPLAPVDVRIRPEVTDQKREPLPLSPSSGVRCSKDYSRRDTSREYSKRSSYFEDELTPTASASSDASDRQRLSSELKATPEELSCDIKDSHQSTDGFASEDSGRDSFFNGDTRFDDDAFTFKSELEDNVPDHRATTLPLKNSRQKYGLGNNNNNNKGRGDQYIRKSESVNIFAREKDPFDGDDFFK